MATPNVIPIGVEGDWPVYIGAVTYGEFVIDAAGEMVGHSARIYRAGTINQIHFRLGLVAQAPVNGLKVSFQGRQDVGNYAVPDETPTHFRVVPQGSVAPNLVASGLVTDDGTDTGAKKTVAVGDILTIVYEFENWQAGDDVDIGYLAAGGEMSPGGTDSCWVNWKLGGGGWLGGSQYACAAVIEFSDGVLVPLKPGFIHAGPSADVIWARHKLADNPNETGAKFVAPYTGKIGGIHYWALTIANYTVNLYDTNGLMGSVAQDNYNTDSCMHVLGNRRKVWFDSPISVIAGETYRITVKSADDLDWTYLYYNTYSAAMAAALVGGSDFVFTQGKNGVWVDTTTRKPLVVPFYSELEVPSGGGIIRRYY